MRETTFSEAYARMSRPQRVVLAVAVDRSGQPNIIPLGWHMQTSGQPLMIAVSIAPSRYSHALISEGKEFVIAAPSEAMTEQVLYCGTHSGRDTDKFKETCLTAVAASKVKPPLIEQCVANLECVLKSSLETGDHTIFVGEVVAAHVSDDRKRNLLAIGSESGYEYLGGDERHRFGVVRDR